MSIVKVFVSKPLAVLAISTFVALLAIGCSIVVNAFEYELPFYLIYFLMPVVWFIWIVSLFKLNRVKDYVFSIGAWGINLATFWVLISLSALGDESLYQSKGLDLIVFISNAPIMIPFGGYGWYAIDSFMDKSGISLKAYGSSDVYLIWLDILMVSLIQVLSLFAIKILFFLSKKVLRKKDTH